MAEARQPLSAKSFYSQIADAVDDFAGRIQALPLGLSLPVLFWNKDSFRKAGLDPETPAENLVGSAESGRRPVRQRQ